VVALALLQLLPGDEQPQCDGARGDDARRAEHDVERHEQVAHLRQQPRAAQRERDANARVCLFVCLFALDWAHRVAGDLGALL
jgi:hypothetical protein